MALSLVLALTLVLALVRNIIFSKVRVLVLNQPISSGSGSGSGGSSSGSRGASFQMLHHFGFQLRDSDVAIVMKHFDSRKEPPQHQLPLLLLLLHPSREIV